ncbi:MAG: AAC(3)-I family aminoglycoside N-acetyltransferase [Casimicrobiaceae bacterium]
MTSALAFTIRQLVPGDAALLEAVSTMFGEAFDAVDTYGGARPSSAYLERLLAGDSFIALAAQKDGVVVGGVAAYELRKFEQARSEVYLYDLAVAAAHRREGIATALIGALGKVASARGAYVMFVQADLVDGPAIALYDKLGTREAVLHFDIAVADDDGAAPRRPT